MADGVIVPKKARRPVYDPAKDGNRFTWIMRASQELRAIEQTENELRRIRVSARRKLGAPEYTHAATP